EIEANVADLDDRLVCGYVCAILGSESWNILLIHGHICEGFAQVIDHVKENDHQGKSPLNESKLLDAYTNTVRVFGHVEDEDCIGCPLMGAASACGLKVCIYLHDALLGSVGVLELAVSKAQDAHIVPSRV
ncbi:hypothetical protein Tco_1076866, partial [Tanacetum coccineum]